MKCLQSAMRQFHPHVVIITAIVTILMTVGVLWRYGYIHFAKPQDALLLQEYTMLKTMPGEDYKITLKPAQQTAQCVDGIVVLFDTQQKGLTGVLINDKKQAIHCTGNEKKH